ncbi:peptidase M12 [Mucilaginibacter hurinus]|uniref:Peptidase M12 n=1 Tax=Mucilaginibacter hurinus TaxID=2201324 RepID=A0A367GJQ5_9SPHI|nr:matrixin family metalloprotease [Mucilaginibacter hurinus]RCH53699.1 peptidase M12 [Mucilaginibacter hurinus]
MTNRIKVYFLALTIVVAGCAKKAEIAPESETDDARLLELFSGDAPKMCINKAVGADDKHTHGVVLRDKFWSNGQKLRVKFMNEDSFLHGKVLKYASKWMQHANISVQLVTGSAPSDIRIAFKYEGDETSWSYIGKDAKLIDKTKPTMNFGWFTKTTAEDEFSRVIIHEVGHALGLAHEQSSPAVNINWNKANVYWYYKQPPNSWTTEQIDYNIFYRYPASQVYHSPYDPKSIMQYPVDPRFTKDGIGIGWNTVLSSIDKIVIGRVYPK